MLVGIRSLGGNFRLTAPEPLEVTFQRPCLMHPEIVVGVEEVEGILDAYGVLVACRVQHAVIEEARVMHGLGSDLHLLQ